MHKSLPTVVGVRFGDNYTSCKRVLDKRFNGGRDSYQYSTNKLRYDDVSFAGERFDYVDFEFQVEGNATYLYFISFVSRFNLSSDEYAKQQRDRLYTVFLQKYEFRWSGTDKDGFKYWTVLRYGPVNFVNPSDEI